MAKTKIPGGTLSNGVLITGPSLYGDNHKNLARAGAPKRLTVPALAPGMHRATTGAVHPYLHGQAVDDEIADKLHVGKGNVPTHPGMKQAYRGHHLSNDGTTLAHERPGESDAVLQEAGRMGAPVGGWKR